MESTPNGDRHFFSVKVACLLGVPAAVVFNHISFWILENEKHSRNLHEGKHWMYDPVSKFRERMPYFSENQIWSCINKLIKAEFLIVGNFNRHSYDRTNWYAFGPAYSVTFHENRENSISENSDMESRQLINADNDSAEPIPNRNQIKTNSNIAHDASTSASGRRLLTVSQFLNCSKDGPEENYKLHPEIIRFSREKLEISDSWAEDIGYAFWEFWDRIKNQPHGRKTHDEWINELKGWMAKDARGGF